MRRVSAFSVPPHAVMHCFDLIDAEGTGCFTMSDLYDFNGEGDDGKSNGPVYVLNEDDEVDLYPSTFTGKWLLTSELWVTGGGETLEEREDT